MVNYLIRVAYNDADNASIFERMNTELAKFNVAAALTSDDGKGYYLPAGEYCYSGAEPISEVRDAIYRLAESLKPGASVMVMEVSNLAWAGLRQVDAPHFVVSPAAPAAQ